MTSRTQLSIALVLTGCAIETTAASDASSLAPDAVVLAPDAAVVAPDAWSSPDAWTPPSEPSPPTGSEISASANGVLSSSNPCFIQMPDGGMVNAVRASASARCAVGTAEYRFSAQYVMTSMPMTGFTPWGTSNQACMEAPTVGYGVRFWAEVRCRADDGTVSSSVSESSCVMHGGGAC